MIKAILSFTDIYDTKVVVKQLGKFQYVVETLVKNRPVEQTVVNTGYADAVALFSKHLAEVNQEVVR